MIFFSTEHWVLAVGSPILTACPVSTMRSNALLSMRLKGKVGTGQAARIEPAIVKDVGREQTKRVASE
jgi:hypothetical protein